MAKKNIVDFVNEKIVTGAEPRLPKVNSSDLFTTAVNDRNTTRRMIDNMNGYSQDAADQSKILGKIINAKGEEADIPEKYTEGFESVMGYNGMVYKKNLLHERTKEEQLKILGQKDLNSFSSAYTKSEQEYRDGEEVHSWLVPSYHPEHNTPILKEFIGTKKELDAAGEMGLRKYGFQEDQDGYLGIKSLIKGGLNTINETDDMLLGAARLVATPFGGIDALTKMHNDALQETEEDSFLGSKGSDDFGSLEWMGAGVGSGLASLLQFGGIGRGVRGAVMGAEILGAFGKQGLKNEAKRLIADKIVSYGASGIVGFGYGFNDAKKNGLSDGEAAAFGSTLGLINTYIETKMGADFDRMLTGGGMANIAKALRNDLTDLSMDVTEENLGKLFEANKAKYLGVAQSLLKSSVPEGGEEVLQTLVEQTSHAAYNALFAGNESEVGKGKFEQDAFNFKEIVSAGIFGFSTAAPFGMRMKQDRVRDAIMDGNVDQVKMALDNIKASDKKMTQKQYDNIKNNINAYNDVFVANKDVFQNLEDKDAKHMKDDLWNMLTKRNVIHSEIDQAHEGLADDTIQNGIKVSEKAKKTTETLQAKLATLNKEIENYSDVDFINKSKLAHEALKITLSDHKAGVFDLMMAGEAYQEIQDDDDLDKRIEDYDSSKSPFAVFNTIWDFSKGVTAFNNGTAKDKAKLKEVLLETIKEKNLHLSGVLRNNENFRKFLVEEAGYDIIQLPASDIEIEAAKSDSSITAGRHISQDQFNNDYINGKDVTKLAVAAAGGQKKYDKMKAHSQYQARVNAFFGNRKKFSEVTDLMLASMDNKSKVEHNLNPEQSKAITRLIARTQSQNGVTIIVNNVTGKKQAEGLYSNSTGVIHVSADVDRISELSANKNRTASEEKELVALQKDLFRLVTHELGHAQFNAGIKRMHEQWLKWMTTGKETIGASYFQRLLNLSLLSNKVLQDRKKDPNDFYFLRVMSDFNALSGKDKQESGVLNVVREFFSEALSNEAFQAELDSFDIADSANDSIVKSLYDYKRINGVRKSILSEVLNALKSVVSSFQGIFSKAERSILQEAMVLGSNLVVNRRQITVGNPRATHTYSYDTSVSSFSMVDLFPDSENFSAKEFIESIAGRMNQRGYPAPKSFSGNMTDFFNTKFGKSGAYKDGTLKAIYFENTKGLMITWSATKDGVTTQHRSFFNGYGNQVKINTNPFNISSANTLSKADYFSAFSGLANDVVQMEKREHLNNLERAQTEGFNGDATLELDEDHYFLIAGKKIFGEINIRYTFKDGSTGIIGYAPDLAKPRLARMIKGGAEFKVKMKESGPGSRALVRIEDGKIVDVINIKDITDDQVKEYTDKGYTEKRVGKNSEFSYLSASSVAKEIVDQADALDMITTDNGVAPDLSPEALAGLDKIIENRIEYDGEMEDISFFNSETPSDGISIEPSEFDGKIQYVREGVKRKVTRLFYFRTDMNKEMIGKMINRMISFSKEKYLMLEHPEMADQIAFLGFTSKAEETDFIEKLTQELYEKYGHVYEENTRRDGANWDGHGTNPSHSFAEGIKADLESLSYTWDGAKYLISFEAAKNVLFDASRATESWDEMTAQLKSLIEKGVLVGEEKAIGQTILDHYTRDRSQEKSEEAVKWERVKASIWSQFASFKKTDNIVLMPSGDAVRYLNGGKNAELAKGKNDMLSAIVEAADALKQKLMGSGITDIKEGIKFINNELEKFHGKATVKRNGTNVPLLEKAIWTKDDYNNDESDKALLLLDKKDHASFIDHIKNNDITPERYNEMVDRVLTYYKFLGIELSPSLFVRERNKSFMDEYRKRAKAYEKKFIKEDLIANSEREKPQGESSVVEKAKEKARNKAFKELLDAKVSYYNVKTTKFDLRNIGSREVTPLQIALQGLDFINADLRTYLDLTKDGGYKKEKKDLFVSNKEISKLNELMLAERGNYRSGDFYFDPQWAKRWAYKIKSFTDNLFESLQKPESALLKKYRNAEIYKYNTVLQSIAENESGEQMEVTLSGLNSYSKDNKNRIYEDAGDMDFLFMHLAAFSSAGNKFGDSDIYFHIDDVPSDKPNVLAYRLRKFSPKEIKGHIENIIKTEEIRLARAEEKFLQAFAFTKQDDVFTLRDGADKYFDDLIPGIHYKVAKTEKIDGKEVTFYKKGEMFDKTNYFFDGKSAETISAELIKENEREYKKWKEQGLEVPVSQYFEETLKKENLSKEDYKAKLEVERQRIFNEWALNYVVNRYHLSMLNMGDYIYYTNKNKDGSGNEFADLNKRKAGPAAPRQANMLKRDKIKMVAMKTVGITDEEIGDSLLDLHRLEEDKDGKLVPVLEKKAIKSDRTDAQGYITEQFARELTDGYGDFSGYGKIFKPVLFGIDEDRIQDARPLYLKLSLAVLPDPKDPRNDKYYNDFPKQKAIALKVYASGTDIVVFETGIKVGKSHMNTLSDANYKVQEISAKHFGIQNNPMHNPFEEETVISGLVQLTKQLGDNGSMNKELMDKYHALEAKMMNSDANEVLNTLNKPGELKKLVIKNLAKNDYSAAMAVNAEGITNPLDHPLYATHAENLVNSEMKGAVSLIKRSGEKLVNMSELGFERPPLDEKQTNDRIDWLMGMGYTSVPEYTGELRWTGPRMAHELTYNQLQRYQSSLKKDYIKRSPEGYILNDDGDVQIFGADVIVPESTKYSLGDKIIAVRIPTSKKGSVVSGEVVGFLSPSQGNVIIVGKHGPGIIGFDFDIDGFFVWNRRDSNKDVNEMFDIAQQILLSPKNYNEVTSPTVTDTVEDMVTDIKGLLKEAGVTPEKVSRFSPFRQIALKKLNSIGKKMIGITAMWYGIHSILAQSKTTLSENRGYHMPPGMAMNEEDTWAKTDYADNKTDATMAILQGYLQTYTDSDGKVVSVTDIFSEVLNSSADNAKLQQLGELNINPDTAAVLMDMLAHGIDFKYAVLFINQPIIREYVKEKERKESASYRGLPFDPLKTLRKKYEDQITALTGEVYIYNDEDKKASSKRTDVIYRKAKGKIDSVDRYPLSKAQLTDGIRSNGQGTLIELEKQIRILEKFKFYGEMSKVTTNIGALVTLTSSYPKTLGDLINRINKIESLSLGSEHPKVVTNLPYTHPTYKMHYDKIYALLDFYRDNKLYLQLPGVFEKHIEMFGSMSGEKQDNVIKDFYNYILTSATPDSTKGKYNFSTSSWLGSGLEINPFRFVHYSALMIKELQDQFPGNEFLDVLTVKQSTSKLSEIMDGTGDPNFVTASLLIEPDVNKLKAIHKAFDALPDNFTFTYDMIGDDGQIMKVTQTIASTKDVILGHLLHTKGMSLGGLSFSKVLPPDVHADVDRHISSIGDQLKSENEKYVSESITKNMTDEDKDLIAKESPVIVKLNKFFSMAQLNNPGLIKTITDEEMEALTKSKMGDRFVQHVELWGGKPAPRGMTNEGGVMLRGKNDTDQSEYGSFYLDKKNPEVVSLLRVITQNKGGIFNMKDSHGVVRTFEITDKRKVQWKTSFHTVFDFKTVKYINNKNVKQYSYGNPEAIFNDLENAFIENKEYKEEDPEVIVNAKTVNGIPLINNLQLHPSAMGNKTMLIGLDAVSGIDAIIKGKKTSLILSPDQTEELDDTALLTIQRGETPADGFVLVKLLKGQMHNVREKENSYLIGHPGQIAKLIENFADDMGLDLQTANDNYDNMLDENTAGFEVVALVDSDGVVNKWYDKFDPEKAPAAEVQDESVSSYVQPESKPEIAPFKPSGIAIKQDGSISDQQLNTINENLKKAGFPPFTMESINNLTDARKQKTLECYG